MTNDTRAARGAGPELAWLREGWRAAAFEVARDAMLILDDDGVCVDANAAARRLLRVAAGGLTGRTIDEFAAPAVLGAQSRRWAFFLLEGHDEGECELARADGSRAWVEFTLAARIGSNRHLAVLRESGETAEAGGRGLPDTTLLKTMVVRDLNHDLRTPLNGLVGATGLLAATELTDEQREYVDLLAACGEAMTAAIRDIVGFSEVDEGAGGADETPVDSQPRETVNRARLGRRVLVIEDDASSRLVAVRLMQARGLDVDAVGSGQDALEALDMAAYDAIFMNCEMPELDGYATTREIRRREGTERRTPIIAMTASTLPGDAERCHAAGMDFYVAKPIKPAGLDYIIARAIGTAEV